MGSARRSEQTTAEQFPHSVVIVTVDGFNQAIYRTMLMLNANLQVKAILAQVKQLIPPFDGSLHKGQSGKQPSNI